MRRDGRPKTSRHLNVCDEQYEALELLSSRTLGQPSVSSLLRHALDDFIRKQADIDPALAEELLKLRAEKGPNVVPIRAAKG